MRRRLSATICKAVLALSTLMAVPYICAAQEYSNTPVTVSKEKVKVGGKLCYSHIVLEKQTLYSISKAYNVSIDDIYRFNPALKETGLKKNSIILIPSQEALQENNVKSKDLGEIGTMLSNVVVELKSFDEEEEEKGFLGLFKKTSNKITSMKAKYAKAEVNVNKIVQVHK